MINTFTSNSVSSVLSLSLANRCLMYCILPTWKMHSCKLQMVQAWPDSRFPHKITNHAHNTLEVFRAHPTSRWPWGRTKTSHSNHISHLVWENLWIPQEELEKNAGESDVPACHCHLAQGKQHKMDEWWQLDHESIGIVLYQNIIHVCLKTGLHQHS